ncbi:MAG: hypothetical protein B6244_10900 [Candidatus Cloacimonetes bacterium 4572_55]|nr:MAG: hypothetical protein B6244_10900 [Candidatus Cloacimonetes bacterium 4572_55]
MMVSNSDKKEKVLVVDDQKRNIQIVGNILSKGSYELAYAFDGKAALEKTKDQDFDLILLDIMMPKMDGYDVCNQLKKDSKTKDIPVIFLTAKTDIENVVKGFDVGGSDYITKPFNSKELLARVKMHLTIHQQRKTIIEQKDKLIALNTSKDRFFSIIAHDLRNPFMGLMSVLELMTKFSEDVTPEDITFYAIHLKKSTDNTYRLLENLLEWALLQQGRIEFNPEINDLAMITETNLNLFENLAEKKEIGLVNRIIPDTLIFADDHMIATVIQNLINNAVKFTPTHGKITINSRPIDNDFIEISIADTGIGISASAQKKLFHLDQKYTREGTAGEKGTGLGLVLCKEFVEKNGGKIWVKSEVGSGSNFKFTVPMRSC